jgi:hypothetical protein
MNRLLAACCLGLLSLVLLVNSGTSGDKDKKKEFKGMLPPGWKSLKLAPEQVKKIYEIQAAYKAKVEALEDQILEIKGQQTAAMLKVLNADQLALYRKLLLGEVSKEKTATDKKNDDKVKKDK